MANEKKNMVQEFTETYEELMSQKEAMLVDEDNDSAINQIAATGINLERIAGKLVVMMIELIEKQNELVDKQLKAMEAKES